MTKVKAELRQELYNLRQQLVMVKMKQDMDEINRIEEQIKDVRKRISSDLSEQVKEENKHGKNN